jgi:pimeloyl-ACP methyl ester carboxylesterase
MSKFHKISGPYGAVAVRESAGAGKPIVLIHGNSSSSKTFQRQLDGPLGERRRLIAFDLMGFGDSDRANDLKGYLLPGQAKTVVAVAEALGAAEAVFVGWSLGGHILLEAAPELTRALGFAIYGAPPIAIPPAMAEAFLPNPAMAVGFTPDITKEMAEAYVASFFAPGFADVPASFVEDALKADGMARAQVYASMDPPIYRDEVKVVAELRAPLAILHGGREALINGAYFASLKAPTLWRGAVQTIVEAGHAPHWETPAAFDALIEAFASDCEA